MENGCSIVIDGLVSCSHYRAQDTCTTSIPHAWPGRLDTRVVSSQRHLHRCQQAVPFINQTLTVMQTVVVMYLVVTGRNIHALDPYRMPSQAALERGAAAAKGTLKAHRDANHGTYPETVAVRLVNTERSHCLTCAKTCATHT